MGARVVGLLAKFAKVVVVCSEDIAAVVALALNFTNNVEALVVLKELVLHIHFNGLCIFRE